ncbi:MAG: glycine cleavage system protein H [Candidatus Fraserbacteria bacterium RBG_16_55_9]|uniref:Glycine cleavage system H protein n=1 Tax=Fraserbacteria sp. (strain RBG_16_55_9) TaxID=1817864 RepID=A0A1F5UQ25_FRAXR|nr:MAG: glycine cleavage system protein H [Candidatus Fraserbacteria bacterium RBG_16_55_9]
MSRELRYTKDHEWVKAEGKKARMGITEYAQKELGDVVYVELPKEGRTVEQSQAFITVESVKAASDVYAPVSGTVIEVNSNLQDQPELVNQSPYEKGWMAVIEMSKPEELDSLMGAPEYEKHIGELKQS